MSRKLVLPQPPKQYNADDERIRNRELEAHAKEVNQKLAELEARIQALEP